MIWSSYKDATVRSVCNFLGTPLIFETDDNYMEIPLDNPAHFSMISKEELEANKSDFKKLEEIRQRELNNYREIIAMMDGIIVSTEELKRTLYPYNKNIIVLENNVEEVPPYKSYDPEEAFVKVNDKGEKYIDLQHNLGVFSAPSFCSAGENKISWTPRIGWSSTVTHWGSDFNTVIKPWEKLIAKHSKSSWFIYLGGQPGGWNNFVNWHMEASQRNNCPARLLHIPDSQYSLYMMNLRNLDIGIAPLAPNAFNMSKSDLKALEYAINKTAPLLPRYITYSRHWVEGETCLMYGNEREFYGAAETLLNDVDLRTTIGKNAFEYAKANRLERFQSLKRFEFYVKMIGSKNKLKIFKPAQEKNK